MPPQTAGGSRSAPNNTSLDCNELRGREREPQGAVFFFVGENGLYWPFLKVDLDRCP